MLMLLLAGSLDLLSDQALFRDVMTVHLRARAVVQANGIEGIVQYEYWGNADGRYRVECRVNDPRLGLLPSYSHAWDGHKYTIYAPDLDVHSTALTDDPRDLSSLPNPLSLFAPWLKDEGSVRLQHLTDESLWKSRLQAAHGVADGALAVGPYRVWAAGSDRRIEYIDAQGAVVGLSALTMPDDLAGLKGSVMVMKTFGDVAIHAHYTIQAIEVNEPLEAKTFVIDRSVAGTVVGEGPAR